MRPFTELFLIDGEPVLAPDGGVSVTYTDLDAEDTGRDEAGFMHRTVLRQAVGTWTFKYGFLTEAERQYMERLFYGKAEFAFTHPDRIEADREITCKAYRSKVSQEWQNARTGQWKNYKFNIIEC